MILSILICSLEDRAVQLGNLLSGLNQQLRIYGNKAIPEGVEILVVTDKKENSTGFKRNILLKKATGDYVVFIDDDDSVPPYYIYEMVVACRSGADCIAINGHMTTDGAHPIKWRLSKDNDNVTIKEDGNDFYLRKTNHITAVKREHALKAMFPDKSNAEDKAYSEALNQHLKTEFTIHLPMYHYNYSTKNKQY